jgi:DNA polymerase-3 subunit epsilon
VTRNVDPPPPGPPWDCPLAEAPLAFVDLEMTGLDVKCDRVVEICVERVVGGVRVDGIATLIDPGDDRVGGASHVHGLDANALRGAPAFAAVAPEVMRLLDGAIFVAHAAAWDIDFVAAELKRIGIELVVPYYLDTLTLSRRAFNFPTHSLDALAVKLGLARGQAHRAESDVHAMRELFARTTAVLAPTTARDLWEVRIGERRARAAIVDACEAAAEFQAPVILTYRPSHRGPEPIEMVIVEVRSDLDPPRVMGYQLPSRSRRELRADRILRVDPVPVAPTEAQAATAASTRTRS